MLLAVLPTLRVKRAALPQLRSAAALLGSCRRQCSEASVHGAEDSAGSVRGAEHLGIAGLRVRLLSHSLSPRCCCVRVLYCGSVLQ